MTTALITALGVALAGLLGIVQFQLAQIGRRLERIEERLTALETTVARIGERLDAHLTDHPAPGRRV